jgi:DNA polymerase III subunit delta
VKRETRNVPVADSRIYAVIGSDESQVKSRAQVLAAQLSPREAGDFGVDLVDGNADNAEQAVNRLARTREAVQTLPFFGGHKLVWLKNVNFLGDSVMARSNVVQTALEAFREYLSAGIPEDTTLLLSATEVDKRRGFYKALGKLAKLEIFDRIDITKSGWEEEAEAVVRGLAARSGLRFQPAAIELLVRRAGADTRQLTNELEKLDLYLGSSRDVTEEIVGELVARSASGVIWELSNCLGKRNLPASLRLLDQLMRQGETPIGILFAAIIPTMRNLVVAKDLLERYRLKPPSAPFQFPSLLGRLSEEAVAHLPRRKDGSVNMYGLGLAAVQAHRFTLHELLGNLEDCLTANLQLVTTQLDPRLVLTELLVKILA